jgi:hypothetical protein
MIILYRKIGGIIGSKIVNLIISKWIDKIGMNQIQKY